MRNSATGQCVIVLQAKTGRYNSSKGPKISPLWKVNLLWNLKTKGSLFVIMK